ncbi:MAG: tetratricopeptide repeat protein [Elusimicrobiales bacterium]|nr:tetratricopeptide repeat protein [Elusimicrobiales bacterium]
MKNTLIAVLLLAPALLAAEPPQPPPGETPEARAALQQEAAQLEKLVLASPSDPELYTRLGFTYARLRQADDAQRAFENAVRLDPKKAPAWYMLGLIYEKKGLKDKALAAWKACLENAQDARMRDTAARHIHHLSQP